MSDTDSKRQTRRLTHAQIVLLDDWLRSANDALHQAVPKVAEAASAALGFTVPESSIRTGAEARGLSVGRLPEPDLLAALEARMAQVERLVTPAFSDEPLGTTVEHLYRRVQALEARFLTPSPQAPLAQSERERQVSPPMFRGHPRATDGDCGDAAQPTITETEG